MKYAIKMGCGHEDIVELFGPDKDRGRKIAYFQEHGLCKECYKKQMREKEKEMGLRFGASALPAIDREGNIIVSVWFEGDTLPYKDEIKSLGGYHFSEREAAADFYSFSAMKCWNKTIKADEVEEEYEKAKSIGAQVRGPVDTLFESIHYTIALEKQQAFKERQAKIAAIEKPPVPDILKGHKWNQKIYGRAGRYSIYLDGEQVNLSDEVVKEVKAYLPAKEEYDRKIKNIEKDY